MKLNKKAQVLDNLAALGIGIATLTIVLTVTFLIINQGETQAIEVSGSNMSHAANSTRILGSAVDTIPGWVPLIVIAVIGSLLLGLVALFRR